MADHTPPGHALSLSAGCVLDLEPAETVGIAAASGYDLVGVRLANPRAQRDAVARALADHPVGLLDVEVVRLGADPLTDHDRALAETAADLGARFLLTVSDEPDEDVTTARVAELVDLLRGAPTRVALEPMRFTGVRTREAAERVARAAGATVLLDPLHLHRTGDDPARPADRALTGYAQLTDLADPGTTPPDLAHEARHDRVPPGHGGLDLGAFVAGLPPAVPLAVEVQSDRLRATTAPLERALMLRLAAETVLRGTA
ncbi:sugar phosphate isomerase/epimerase [Actinomycetospora succinea]|uniref:Sugar phosphate isomerase/epimerase n=1 Tax=Actinomycetospora succinea TaxID=663603 RepID=A0A4R6UWP5_9PSEU|nr:TIM barrel protein [Actinomycetospora succinea]TDQ51800.1 sugar phosphate isomerase/epimerase [Actinomycetospora succinea]